MNKFFKIAAVAVISFFAGIVTSNVFSRQPKLLNIEFDSDEEDNEDLEVL